MTVYERFRRVMEVDPPFTMPEFWDENPEGWFIHLERSFAKFGITCERQKFLLTLRFLDVLPVVVPPSATRIDIIAGLKKATLKQLFRVKKFIEFFCCCIRTDTEPSHCHEKPDDVYVISHRQISKDVFLTIGDVIAQAEAEAKAEDDKKFKCEGDDNEKEGAVGGVSPNQKKLVPRKGEKGIKLKKGKAQFATPEDEYNYYLDKEVRNVFGPIVKAAHFKTLEEEEEALEGIKRTFQEEDKLSTARRSKKKVPKAFNYKKFPHVYFMGPLSETEERLKGMNVTAESADETENTEYSIMMKKELIKEKRLSGLLFRNSIITKLRKKVIPRESEERDSIHFLCQYKGKK